MSEPSSADPGQQLISDAERQSAISALQAHRASGRLSSAEYEDRQVLASSARRWEELTRLFSDLPQPHPAPGGVVAVPGQALPAAQPVPGQPVQGQEVQGQAAPGLVQLPPETARGILALTPFVAVLLFFVAPGGWLWFLLIPVMGIILGQSASGRSRRDRRRNR
jgi:hypothetical protein